MRDSKSTLIDYGERNPFKEAVVGTARCISYSLGAVRKAVRLCVQELPDLQETFSKADNVLLKPNLLSSTRKPDDHVNTHPRLVQAVAEVLIHDFKRQVAIGDSCCTLRSGSSAEAIRNSGIEEVARAVGARIYNVDAQPRHVVPFERGRVLKEVPLPSNLGEFDLIVSIAKMKTHMLTLTTGAVKNMLGLVPGEAKKHCHMLAPRPDEFATLLADLYTLVRPGAAFVDGVVAMEGAGPSNGELRHVELLAASGDGVALDAFCAQVMGLDPLQVPLLAQCHDRGLGIAVPADVIVRGEPATAFAREKFARPRTYAALPAHLVPRWVVREALRQFSLLYAAINQEKCQRCGECAKNCPSHAIHYDKAAERFHVNRAECISCYCCAEVCPYAAVDVQHRWPKRLLDRLRSPFRSADR
jgi:uncharacterized protein (DUF362 family)/Pyruvate/2-oxoacid:ferredoxin oxidoreductase delta subunit